MADHHVHGTVSITAEKYRDDDTYGRAGFVLGVYAGANAERRLARAPLQFVSASGDADTYRIDPTPLDAAGALYFAVEHRDDAAVRLRTRAALAVSGPAAEGSLTLYSGTNDVGTLVATISAQEAPAELARGISARAGGPRAAVVTTSTSASDQQPFWVTIRNRTGAITFPAYKTFIDAVFCEGINPDTNPDLQVQCEGQVIKSFERVVRARANARAHAGSVDAYNLLKVATDAFLIMNCGVFIDATYDAAEEASRLGEEVDLATIRSQLASYLSPSLPYFDQIIANLVLTRNVPAFCGDGYVGARVDCPCLLELIWSYWHEEGMLVQTMNAISYRFQNRLVPGRDTLANLELNPLRPLNNLLWGYVEDEPRRLSVVRRAYEYDHQYGLRIVGKAVPELRTADRRSKFIEAFHNLLLRAVQFYQEDDDTTVNADAFPLLNALKEVHLILAYGAHNQFGDMSWEARKQMLMMQWLLARPEMQAFLRGRAMVPYQEGWMGTVDTMKTMQGWTDASVTHFHSLATFGEQLLLSIRYGSWSTAIDQAQAADWARYWRPEVQGYAYAYQAVTGVDLTAGVTGTQRQDARYQQPAVHLQRRLQTRSAPVPKVALSTNGRG